VRNQSRKEKSVDISLKDDPGNHDRRSQKFPEQERNKRRGLSRGTENNGTISSFQIRLPAGAPTAEENLEFWPQGAIIKPFQISYGAWRQHSEARFDM